MTKTITIREPDDWHLHLRDGPVLAGVLPQSHDFRRAIIMPNLVPPVVTTQQASDYRQRILDALPNEQNFTPLMTLYLTERTEADDVTRGFSEGIITAVKLYPAGATTNSDSGVKDFDKVMPVLERMCEIGLPLCVHGEVTTPEIDIFDREAVFIERVLAPLRDRLPELRVVMEHVTTAQGIDYVREASGKIAATLTVQHLMLSRNDMLVGGIRPHFYCLPILKRDSHRAALVQAATSGDPKFFLGTDSAPHVQGQKESACGCAGVFSAPVALPWIAQVFAEEGALEHLESFTSLAGPAFYGLPPNEQTVTLEQCDTPVPFSQSIPTDAGPIVVYDPGRPLHWRIRRS